MESFDAILKLSSLEQIVEYQIALYTCMQNTHYQSLFLNDCTKSLTSK